MDKMTQDILFDIARVVFGVAVYGLCMALAFALCRIGENCFCDIGGIRIVGALLFSGSYLLPVLFAGFFEKKYIRGKDGWRAAMFAFCAVAALFLGLFASFIDNGLIRGRDITPELFLWLVMLVVPIVYAVRSYRNNP